MGIDVEDTARPTGMQSYGQSKLGNIFMAQHWAAQLKDQGVVSVSVVRSKLTMLAQVIVANFPNLIPLAASWSNQYRLVAKHDCPSSYIYGQWFPVRPVPIFDLITSFGFFLQNWTTHSVEKGALTQLYAGTSPAVTLSQSGSFYVPWARLDSSARSETSDSEFGKRVIGLMKEQVDAKLP